MEVPRPVSRLEIVSAMRRIRVSNIITFIFDVVFQFLVNINFIDKTNSTILLIFKIFEFTPIIFDKYEKKEPYNLSKISGIKHRSISPLIISVFL